MKVVQSTGSERVQERMDGGAECGFAEVIEKVIEKENSDKAARRSWGSSTAGFISPLRHTISFSF